MSDDPAARPSPSRGDGHGSSIELEVCQLLRRAVGYDRVAVVVVHDVNTRAALRGSDAALEHYCDLQQTLVQGPSLDAFEHAVPIVVDDLRTAPTPWPLLSASTPADLAVRALAVLPLRLPGAGPLTARGVDEAAGPAVLGLLAVGRDQPRPFTREQVADLTALAGLLTAVVLQRASTEELFTQDAAPGEELPIVVGMLRARLGAGAADALAHLRAYAFSADTTIHRVAREVLSGHVDLADVARS